MQKEIMKPRGGDTAMQFSHEPCGRLFRLKSYLASHLYGCMIENAYIRVGGASDRLTSKLISKKTSSRNN